MDDGTAVLIEMHLYRMEDLKHKTIRSWARAYSEELKVGMDYASQPPVVCVAFVDGPIDKSGNPKIHKCCKITDIDDKTVFSDALELHYIDMSAFAKTVNETGAIDKNELLDSMLAKWLAVIAEKAILDKSIIKSISEEGEIGMAVSTLSRISRDKITRQEYQKRQDEIFYQNRREARIAALEAEVAEKDAIIRELRSKLDES